MAPKGKKGAGEKKSGGSGEEEREQPLQAVVSRTVTDLIASWCANIVAL